MKNYRHDGRAMYVVPAVNVVGGRLYYAGGMFGVMVADCLSGQTGVMWVDGVFNVPKDVGTSFTQGQAAYWLTTSPFTAGITGASAASLVKLGVVADATAASSATAVNVRFNGVF